jgi:ADP-heptose:LPS heptosyltransferase
MEDKRWPAENYARLAAGLADVAPLVYAGAPSDAAVNAAAGAGTAAADLTAMTSVPALYLILRGARAFIGNDSAPMHLAAAAACPTVAFFGPTNPTLNGPWKTRSLVLQGKEACAPCYADGYFPPCDHRRCLTAITPEHAAAAIREFLDTRSRV